MTNTLNTGSRLAVSMAVIAGLLVWSMGTLHAQVGPDIRVTMESDTPELTVGDPVQLTLQVTYPEDYQAIFSRLPFAWGNFEVQNQSPVKVTANDDGTQTASRVIDVTLYTVGKFETPAITVTIRGPDGQVFDRESPTVTLDVVSVVQSGDDDLRDIRPSADLPVPPLWPWIVTPLVLAGLVAVGLYFLLRRRTTGGGGSAGVWLPDPRTPYEIVTEELARIERLNLPDAAKYKEHYALVADSVRGYLEGEYKVAALEQTTDELRKSLESTPLSEDQSKQILNLLKDCDLVKFTKLTPEIETSRLLVTGTRSLVDAVRPRRAIPVVVNGEQVVGASTV